MRTLGALLKFDSGLTIGRNLVDLSGNGKTIRALVDISRTGIVRMLVKPGEGDMYSSWQRVNGDSFGGPDGAIIVWGARNPDVIAMFDGDARAIDLEAWFQGQLVEKGIKVRV